jgi:hypothetical protein
MPNFLQTILENPTVSLVRRIHGLEHATINILSQRRPGIPMAGHSDPSGFWLIGDLPTEAVNSAVSEALARLQSGEKRLAIAPMCGTNIVTIGTLAGLAGALVMWDAPRRLRDKLDRIPLAISMATLATFLALPLGVFLQERVTTSGVPGALQVTEIRRIPQGGMTAHRVTVRG